MNVRAYIVICVLATAQLHAQSDSCNGVLHGRIIDEHDRLPLAYATVYIPETGQSAVSDEDGKYAIDKLCKGLYTVRIQHLGCEDLVVKVQIKEGHTHRTFYPEHHVEELKKIDVVSERAKESTTQALDTLSQKSMQEVKGKTLGEALKKIPGVTTLQTGASIAKPVIHGMHSNRILILNNGVRQEGQQWGSEHAPEIDPFIAGNLAVIKGAAGVRYGSDAMAGVILVSPRKLRDSAGIGGELNLVGFSNGRVGAGSAMLEGNFRKLSPFSWRVQGTYKQGGNVQAPRYYLKNTGTREYNFSYALRWKKQNYGAEVFYSQFNTTLGIFSGAHIGNLTDLQKAFTNSEPAEKASFSYEIARPFQHIEHELLKVNAYLRTGEAGKLLLTYARQYNLRYEYDKHRPLDDSLAALNQPDLQFEITTHTADLIWEHARIGPLVGSVGVNAITQGNTWEGRYFIPNFRNNSGGLFLIERLKKAKYEAEFGLRYDYRRLQVYKYEKRGAGYVLTSPVRNFGNASGTLGFIYKPDSTWRLTINSGSAWRAPNVNELYSSGLHHGSATFESGDTLLDPEMAFNNIASLNYSPGRKLAAEVSVYCNYVNDFIYLKPILPATLTIRGAFPTFRYTQTDALLRGIDAMIVYRPRSAFETTLKASLLRASDMVANDWLILMPADRYEAELTYKFKSTKRTSGAYVSISGQLVTKQWRVPAGDYLPPPAEYYLLNFESGITIKVGKQPVAFGFGVQNLLDASYRDYLDRFRYFTDAIGRNFSLRIRVPLDFSFKNKRQNNSTETN